MRIYTIIIIAYLAFHSGHAMGKSPVERQQKVAYTHYTSAQNLPSSVVYKIVQDKYGYLWMVSDKGLIRYNSQNFEVIATYPNEDFIDCFLDKNNLLWLMSYRGRTIGVNLDKHSLVNTDSIYGLRGKDCWVYAQQIGDTIHLISNKGHLCQRIIQLSKNKSVAYTGKELVSKDLLRFLPSNFNYLDLMFKFVASPYSFSFRGDSLFLLNNSIYFPKLNDKPKFYFDGDAHGLRTNITDFLRVGKDLWLSCTEAGYLLRFKNYFNPQQKQQVDTLLNHVPTTRMMQDADGNVWVGSYGYGVYKFDDGKLELYNSEGTSINEKPVFTEHFPMQKIKNILFFQDSWLIIGNKEIYASPTCANGLPGKFSKGYKGLNSLINYKDCFVYNDELYLVAGFGMMATLGNKFVKIQGATDQRILTATPYKENWIWGSPFGLFYKNQAIPYLKNTHINQIRLIGDRYFICTNEGVFFIRKEFVLLGKGLTQLSSVATYNVEVKDGFLYFQTDKNISIYINEEQPKFNNSISASTIKNLVTTTSFVLADSFMAVLGEGVITTLSANQLLPNSSKPYIHILNTYSQNEPGDTSCTIAKKPVQNPSFKLEILDFGNSQYRASYKVTLNGKTWLTSDFKSNQRTLTLPVQEPGDYVLVFTIFNETTGKFYQRKYVIHVIPQWYQTVLWYSFCFGLLIVSIILLTVCALRYATRRANQKFAEKRRLFELEAKSIVAQMNPHFIFNTLTPLQYFILKGDKMGGLNYLNKYVSLVRGRISSIRERYTSLQKELDFLEDYMQLKQSNADHPFTYSIELQIEEQTEALYLPNLVIQPLVENAIEHGLSDLAPQEGRQIKICLEQADNVLKIAVIDNGKGLPADFEILDNHALHIINERLIYLRKQFGTGYFSLKNNANNNGVTAFIHLPLLYKNDTL